MSRSMLMALLATGVSAAVLSASPALGAPFTPATPWTVNRIDPANGSAAYCTLARRFSGNTVITFARNVGGEGTIAVDFQQPLFNTNETYRIGLQAGDGMKREFMTRPATPNALVLRTGQDPEFFNALSGSTELGVIMDERRYAFSFPDFAAGTNQLQNCIGVSTTVTPMAGNVAPVALPDNPELAQMRAELDQLRNENAGIVASLKEQTAETRAPQQSAEGNQLMQRLSALEQEKNGLVEKLQAGQQQEMQDVSALKSALEDQKAMKSMLESERSQRQQLEQALTTQTAEAEKRGEMKARIEQLEASNKELKNLRDAVETERSKRVAAENALKEQATASLEEQERVRARIADLETQNKSLMASADELVATKSRLEDTTAQASLEQARRQAAEGALKDMQISISQREADMASLQAKVEIERQKMEAAENAKEAALMRQHADEMARLNAAIQDMKTAQAMEVSSRQAQIDAMKAAQAKGQAEREALNSKISAEQARREAAESTVRDMQTSISKREADMIALQSKMDAERQQMEAASAANQAEISQKHQAEIARMTAEMEQTKAAQEAEIQARADLQGKIASEQARREAAEKTVAELQTQIEAERTKLINAEADKEAALMKKHQDEIAKLNAELGAAKQTQQNELDQARKNIEAAQNQAQAEIDRIKAQQVADAQAREELQTKIATEGARREAAERAMTEYQNKVDAERKKMTEAENAKQSELVKQHQDEIARLTAEMEQAKTAQQAEMEQARAEIEQAKIAQQDEIEKARAEIEQARLAQQRELEKAQAEAEQVRIAQQEAMAKAQAEAVAEVERMKAAQLAEVEQIKAEQMAEVEQIKAQKIAEVEQMKSQQMAEAQSRDDLQATIATEAARREAAEKAMAQYQNKVEEERQKLAAAEAAKENDLVKQHEDEIARLNKELALIKTAQAEELQKVQVQASSESARREATEKELQEARAKLADAEGKAQSGNAEMTAKMAAMETQLKDMESRNAALISDLETARTQTHTAESEAARTHSAGAEADARIADITKRADADKQELQDMLQTEQERREKVKGMLAKGSDDDARMKIMGDRMNELQARNNELQQKLEEQKAASANAVNPAAGDSEEVDALRKQLAALKGDNEMLAEKLATVANQPQQAVAVDMKPVSGDGQMATDLAETQASLASVMAERDEYRGLLQRERQRPEDAKAPKGKDQDPGAIAQIKKLEGERADLVRQLEYERSRIDELMAGKTITTPDDAAAQVASDKTTADLNQRLAAVEAEKAALEKQVSVMQNDVIEARQQAKFSAAKGNAGKDADVAALLDENKKLQMELAQSTSKSGDTRAMESEITALRAQNTMLNDEINKRLAAAPDRATVDNAEAKAAFTTREAKAEARKEVAADLSKVNNRLVEADAENIRLAKELAQARQAKVVTPIVANNAPDQAMATTTPPVAMMRAQPVNPTAMYTPASIAAAPAAMGPDGRDISSYLQRAGVPMVSGVEKINKVSTAKFAAFRWDTGVVFGTAEQQAIGSDKAFKDAVNAYMEKTRNRCSGTFDQSMADGSNSDVATADVACIMPDGTGAGAAMVFYYKDGMFNAIAHEGNLETFDQAMTTRDKLAGFIKAQM